MDTEFGSSPYIHTVPEDPFGEQGNVLLAAPTMRFYVYLPNLAVNGASRPTARDVGYERGRSRVV
jgi:hypothetical protein